MNDCSQLGQVICSFITARFSVANTAAPVFGDQRVLVVSQVKRRQLGALVVVVVARGQVSLKIHHSNRLLIQSELKFLCSAHSFAFTISLLSATK